MMSESSVVTESTCMEPLRLKHDRELRFERPLVMGVLNVTPDSFSDGGRFFDVEAAIDHAFEMERQGADIIDIGGESSRPGAEPVTADEEQARVLPVMRAVRDKSTIPVSIDTYHANTARMALDAGADIINDISALRFDRRMAEVVRESGAPVILMHMLGEPRTMQKHPKYNDCVREIGEFFEERIAFCTENGIDESSIVIDPGIGFGKRVQDNLDILAHLSRFRRLCRPLMVGASRKSFIGKIHKDAHEASSRLGGSMAAAVTAVVNGADMIRVHDVGATVEALKVLAAIRERL